MSRPTLRRSILLRSVQLLLDDGEQVREVAMLFTRHRWFWPYSLLAGTMIFVVASASEVEGGVNRVLLGLCGLAIAGLALVAIAAAAFAVLRRRTAGAPANGELWYVEGTTGLEGPYTRAELRSLGLNVDLHEAEY